MQFSCESTQLAKGVNTVRKAISSSPNAPLFSGIHMILQGNELKLVAMDINFSMEKTMEVNGQEDGSILVPAQYICDLLARFNNQVRMFPGSVVAGILGFAKRDYLAEDTSKKDYPVI